MREEFDRSVLSGSAARLLDVLLEFADAQGRTQVPTSTLAGRTGLTQGGLMQARNELTRHGLLRTEPGFSANGLRGPNVYRLNLGELAPASSASSADESGRSEASLPARRSGGEDLPESSRGRRARPGRFRSLFRRGRTES